MRLLLTLFMMIGIITPSYGDEYTDFLTSIRGEIQAKGLSVDVFDQAMGQNPVLDLEVIRLLGVQPESTYTFSQYFDRLVSPTRVANGKEKMALHQATLQKMEDKYGVPKEIMLALWGVETAYGKLPGNFKLIPSLATLSYKSHRPDFFKSELFNAIKIIEEGHIDIEHLTGSWAGAMGQCQFMPSSFFKFAEDGNGDGKKDIWQTEADVFASTANYISKSGWVNKNWGDRVTLTKFLPKMKISERGLSDPMPVSYWKSIGVDLKKHRKQDETRMARLFMPDGPSGYSYLVYENFEVIMKWNRSSYFAFAVLSLGDAIQGRAMLKK